LNWITNQKVLEENNTKKLEYSPKESIFEFESARVKDIQEEPFIDPSDIPF
jgi:hypothetical protein